jgi:hypothetical protein
MPPPPSQSNNPNQLQPPPLMSLNPFNENTRENASKQLFIYLNKNKSSIDIKDLRPPSNIYENTPPALMSMSMPMSHYDNNNNNNNQHDDYRNAKIEQPFDLNMVTDEIPYYDLPAGLMCLLVKVMSNFKMFLFISFCFLG